LLGFPAYFGDWTKNRKGLRSSVPWINSAGKPVLVNAQILLAFTGDEIHRLIGCQVILDAISVEILLRRGFGKAIGVESAERVSSSMFIGKFSSKRFCFVFILQDILRV